MTRKAVFLDRDGVLIRPTILDGRPFPPIDLESAEILPGVQEGCERLREGGYLLFMVTNQPDVARGMVARMDAEAINARVARLLGLDDVAVCFHDDRDNCECRKPKPGMLVGLARKWAVDLPKSYMVGDRWRDIEAGRRAGCRTVFLDWGYAESCESTPDSVGTCFADAVEIIRRGEGEARESLEAIRGE